MSLYVPAMQNASYANLIQQSGRDTAKSFLDGVRMFNENRHRTKMMENERERIDIQRQTMENNKYFQNQALSMTKKNFQDQQTAMQNERDLIRGVVDFKVQKNKANQQIAEKANELHDGPAHEKESFWFKPDVHGTDGWEFYQYQTPAKMAEATLRKKGELIEPKMDESLLSKIQNRGDIGLLDYLQQTGQSLMKNYFGEE
jgi:Tfp pilus assembly protein PilE